MPVPSSLTRMRRRPPPSVTTSMRVAPASSAFSTSSFTALAGRSTTSPAAIRLAMASLSWRTGMGWPCGESPKFTDPAQRRREDARLVIRVRLRPPQSLDRAAAFLALQPLGARGRGRLGGAARLWRDRGFADHLDQPCERVVAVALLGAIIL